jgi:hypothetical protein
VGGRTYKNAQKSPIFVEFGQNGESGQVILELPLHTRIGLNRRELLLQWWPRGMPKDFILAV